MKYYLILLFTATVLLSCNPTSEHRTNELADTVFPSSVKEGQVNVAKRVDTASSIEQTYDEQDTEGKDYRDSIKFDKYPAYPQKRRSNAPINWESNPEAKSFKTRINTAYQESDVSFGGYYVLATFGCGASCVMGFMIDVRDGKIYDLPLGEENSCLFAEERILCKSISKLFVSGVCKENIDARKVFYTAYLWDEENKKFNAIKEDEFVKLELQQ